MPWKLLGVQKFRDNYKNKIKTLEHMACLLDARLFDHSSYYGSDYSQASHDSHYSRGFQGEGAAAPPTHEPPQENDIRGLPTPPNFPVSTSVERGPTPVTPNSPLGGIGRRSSINDHTNSQPQDAFKAVLENQNALLEKLTENK